MFTFFHSLYLFKRVECENKERNFSLRITQQFLCEKEICDEYLSFFFLLPLPLLLLLSIHIDKTTTMMMMKMSDKNHRFVVALISIYVQKKGMKLCFRFINCIIAIENGIFITLSLASLLFHSITVLIDMAMSDE